MSIQGAPQSTIVLAVDAMGGYEAPGAIIEAVARASTNEHDGPRVYFTLVGDEGLLTDWLYETSHNAERIQIHHAPSLVGMGEAARGARDHKPEASIFEACRLVASGDADAVVSSGHPGAAVLGAMHAFERTPGVSRAALATVYPTPRLRGEQRDPFSLLLDVGATLRAEPDELLQFARMGSAYARLVSENRNPRIALLSNSREATIGPPGVVEAHRLMRADAALNFIGNVEGQDIPRGVADVIVCEGFVGDVAIKILEGAGEAAFELARSAYERKFVWRQGLRLLSSGLQKIKRLTDFEEYGGAPLLGLDRIMILAHPRSGARAIHNALKLAIKNVRADLPSLIAEAVDAPTARRLVDSASPHRSRRREEEE